MSDNSGEGAVTKKIAGGCSMTSGVWENLVSLKGAVSAALAKLDVDDFAARV